MNFKKKVMLKRLIIIDVGTHKGKELGVLFYFSKLKLLYLFLKYFLIHLFYRQVGYLNLTRIYSFFKNLGALRSYSVFTIIVEPNVLVKTDIYNQVDSIYSIALAKNPDGVSLGKLFICEDEFSEGNSVFETKKNVTSKYLNTTIVDPKLFFQNLSAVLKEKGILDNAEIVLRINCEGSEDDVIKACKNEFEDSFNLILGSLKDVKEIKGQIAYQNLVNYLESEKVDFAPLNGNCETWYTALVKLSGKLCKSTC